jgi:hypothetical protein
VSYVQRLTDSTGQLGGVFIGGVFKRCYLFPGRAARFFVLILVPFARSIVPTLADAG